MDQDQKTEAIHLLDMEYRGALHRTDLIVKDEEARRLRLRVMVLRDELAILRDQLDDKDSQIQTLTQKCEDINEELDCTNHMCQEQADKLRSQARQQSDLKADLHTLNNISDDSSKILAEKLALLRELSVLKPEVGHLRLQLSHQKDVLAEKLALESQINKLEVDLNNEKRASQKARERQEIEDNEAKEGLQKLVAELEKKLATERMAFQKAKKAQEEGHRDAEEELQHRVADLEKKLVEAGQRVSDEAMKTDWTLQSGDEAELRRTVAVLEEELANERRAAREARHSQEIDDKRTRAELQEKVRGLEKQLVSERSDVERARKASEKESAAIRNHVEMLTQRVEEFKGKLKETRTELKAVRAELAEAGATSMRTTKASVPLKDNNTKKASTKAKQVKKRYVNEVCFDDMMLDTASHDEGRIKRPLKKRGIDVTAVGEKSTFSITPFLEKSGTINLTETINEEDEAEPSILVGKCGSVVPILEPEPEAAEAAPAPAVQQPARTVAKALNISQSKTAPAQRKKARGRSKTGVLTEMPANKSLSAPGTDEPHERGPPSLEKVVEEPEEQIVKEEGPFKTVAGAKKSSTTISAADNGHAGPDKVEGKKKKRKLLGASTKGTLFDKDEEAGDAEAAATPTAAAPTATTQRKPTGLKAAARKGPVSALASNAFAGKTFSPLKRDRRGVNASFLA